MSSATEEPGRGAEQSAGVAVPGSEPGASGEPYADDTLAAEQTGAPATQPAPNMLPGRERRRFGAERLLMRLIATFGVIAIGIAIAAIMTSSNSQGWLIGLVVAGVSVILSAVLWSSRQI
jgi:hypothetical protein